MAKKDARGVRRKIVIIIIAAAVVLASAGTAAYLIARTKTGAGQPDGLSDSDQKRLQSDPRTGSTRLASLTANNQDDAGDYDGAAATLTKAVGQTNVASEKIDLYKQLSSVYTDAKRKTDAENAIGEAIKLSPNDWTLYKRLGLIDEGFGDVPAAKADYQKAIDVLGTAPENDSYRAELQTRIDSAGTDQ